MKSISLFSLFVLVSCSHMYQRTEVAMELPFAPELVEQMQKSAARIPASLETVELEGKSSRRVYFTALYHQYLTLGNHLGQESDVNFCPQFHHDKIETDAIAVPQFSIYNPGRVSGEVKEFFPEVAFTKKFSLEDHYQQISAEVKILCEEGVSDNYYKFDNLVTHYANKASFHARPDSMKSVLKVPVFANYYLLKMLQSPHALVFVHPEEKRVISMTQTHWFEKYVNEAQRQRNNLIKNHMVQR